MNKYSISLSLSRLIYRLSNEGFIHVAENINDILYELLQSLEFEDTTEQEDNDISVAVNSIGLRGDTIPEQPFGGFTVEPFFFDGGDLAY